MMDPNGGPPPPPGGGGGGGGGSDPSLIKKQMDDMKAEMEAKIRDAVEPMKKQQDDMFEMLRLALAGQKRGRDEANGESLEPDGGRRDDETGRASTKRPRTDADADAASSASANANANANAGATDNAAAAPVYQGTVPAPIAGTSMNTQGHHHHTQGTAHTVPTLAVNANGPPVYANHHEAAAAAGMAVANTCTAAGSGAPAMMSSTRNTGYEGMAGMAGMASTSPFPPPPPPQKFTSPPSGGGLRNCFEGEPYAFSNGFSPRSSGRKAKRGGSSSTGRSRDKRRSRTPRTPFTSGTPGGRASLGGGSVLFPPDASSAAGAGAEPTTEILVKIGRKKAQISKEGKEVDALEKDVAKKQLEIDTIHEQKDELTQEYQQKIGELGMKEEEIDTNMQAAKSEIETKKENISANILSVKTLVVYANSKRNASAQRSPIPSDWAGGHMPIETIRDIIKLDGIEAPDGNGGIETFGPFPVDSVSDMISSAQEWNCMTGAAPGRGYLYPWCNKLFEALHKAAFGSNEELLDHLETSVDGDSDWIRRIEVLEDSMDAYEKFRHLRSQQGNKVQRLYRLAYYLKAKIDVEPEMVMARFQT